MIATWSPRVARWRSRQLAATLSVPSSNHGCDGHDGQAGIFQQREAFQRRIGLHFRQCHGLLEGARRLHVHADPVAAIGRWIRVGITHHLDNADDLLADIGVVEEDEVADCHGGQVVLGLMASHARPGFDVMRDLHVPAEGVRFGLHQPVIHGAISPSRNTMRYGRMRTDSNSDERA
jgi:hypothetical protein